ncbi:3'-5' exonuclease [Candidatus Falkowbacteria bacterium HGW-Falkowbacteria-1]|uniref:3'-5' exonuclease n=1 Tax=Candidatus Falkowbacteria bacterium HGW-Falkowbacteria-1 TaxID=2013768 RepID=A0A2N2E9Z1_9BACT|nr:MAG: 3'-5' exonuclease [Candidatus Falkowbacteria bacterium HGW-Falkowbacteria-1]
MSYLFFDTETTGLPKKYNAPISDLDNWPRLVQIAWLLTDDFGQVISEHEYIIKPNGFTIPEVASVIHGIDNLKAHQEGGDLKNILNIFNKSLSDSSPILVAHNLMFDQNILAAEFLRARMDTDFLSLKTICTMKKSISFCDLPNRRFPKLSYLYYKLFNEDFDNAHNALADVVACYRCFFELKKRNIDLFPDI